MMPTAPQTIFHTLFAELTRLRIATHRRALPPANLRRCPRSRYGALSLQRWQDAKVHSNPYKSDSGMNGPTRGMKSR